MAGAVGAELSTLSNLKRTFDQTAQQALDIRTAVDSGVDSAVWTGAPASRIEAHIVSSAVLRPERGGPATASAGPCSSASNVRTESSSPPTPTST